MSKRKTRSYSPPTTPSRPSSKKQSNAQLAREAKDARKFFLVLGIGTILLVLFLYFIFVGRG